MDLTTPCVRFIVYLVTPETTLSCERFSEALPGASALASTSPVANVAAADDACGVVLGFVISSPRPAPTRLSRSGAPAQSTSINLSPWFWGVAVERCTWTSTLLPPTVGIATRFEGPVSVNERNDQPLDSHPVVCWGACSPMIRDGRRRHDGHPRASGGGRPARSRDDQRPGEAGAGRRPHRGGGCRAAGRGDPCGSSATPRHRPGRCRQRGNHVPGRRAMTRQTATQARPRMT